MRQKLDRAGPRRDAARVGILAIALGLAAAAPAVAAEETADFILAAGPPWNCPPALQAQAANCVVAFVLSKDMTIEACPCNQHGANFSTMPIPSNWTQTTYPLSITKWKPPTGTDPCVTYTIGGVPQKICW